MFKNKKLSRCPYCNGEVVSEAYNRMLDFICLSCNNKKTYPGLIQKKVSDTPIASPGNRMPSDIKKQEYYHTNAIDDAVNEFNNWVKGCLREKKIDNIIK